MSTPAVRIQVREAAGGFVTVLVVGGVEFRRLAPDEAEAARVAMEVQGFIESRLGVEFEAGKVTP